MPATASACAEPLVQEPSNRQRLSRQMGTIFVPASLYTLFPLVGPFRYLPCLSAPYTYRLPTAHHSPTSTSKLCSP